MTEWAPGGPRCQGPRAFGLKSTNGHEQTLNGDTERLVVKMLRIFPRRPLAVGRVCAQVPLRKSVSQVSARSLVS